MKILQHPPSDENWSIKSYCTGWGHGDNGCGARLKIYRSDLRYASHSDQKPLGAITYKCVCCGALNDIGFNQRPENHKELKPYKKKWLTHDNDTSNT